MTIGDLVFLTAAVAIVALATLTHRDLMTGRSLKDELREWWDRRSDEDR